MSGKHADIERVNKILLGKMSNIMQETKPKLYNPGRYQIQCNSIRQSKYV